MHLPITRARKLTHKGYHYDWSSRRYVEGMHTPFPPDLAQLATGIAAELGMTLVPEAAIVNLYRSDSFMGGHQDELEFTFQHPVVSVSFGLSAVFLIGGLVRRMRALIGPPPRAPQVR